jgi:chromosome segregation ATPase
MQAAAHNSEEKAGAVAAGRPALSAAVLGKQTALLQQHQQQLDEQELELKKEYASVDRTALQQDLAALQGLAAAHSTLQQLQQQREAAATALEALLDERYSRLLAVLQQLNSRLDAVYGQLTGGCGKVRLQHT